MKLLHIWDGGKVKVIERLQGIFKKRSKSPENVSARKIPAEEALEIPDSFPKEWMPDREIPQKQTPPGSGTMYVHSPLIDIYTKRYGVTPIADLPIYRDLERNQPWVRTSLWKTTHLALEKGGEWSCDDPETDKGKKLIKDTNSIFRYVYSEWMNVVRPCMVYNGLCYGFAPVEKVFAESIQAGYEPNYVKFNKKRKLPFMVSELVKERYRRDVKMKKMFAEVDGIYDAEPGDLINLKAGDPYYFRVLRDSLGNVFGYLQIIAAPYKAFTTDKIMFFTYNPTTVPSESAYGTSVLMALVRSTELLESCENNIHLALHQIVKQPAIFSPPSGSDLMPISDPDWERISSDEQERVAGDSILSRGANVSLIPIDGSALQSALEWHKRLREDVMVGLDVPWVMFGMPMASNRSQSEVNLDDFIVKLHGIQQLVGRCELENIVIPGLLRKGWDIATIQEMKLRYDWNGTAIQDESLEINKSINVFRAGGTTRNEFRDELNLPMLDEERGDVFFDEMAMGGGAEEQTVNPFKSETMASLHAQHDAHPHFPTLVKEIVCPKCHRRDKAEDLSKVILCAKCGTEMKVMKEPPLEWSPDEDFYNEQLKADWGPDIKNGVSAGDIPDDEITKWVTINGRKVPIGKDGKIHPGYDQSKLDRGPDIKIGVVKLEGFDKGISKTFNKAFDKLDGEYNHLKFEEVNTKGSGLEADRVSYGGSRLKPTAKVTLSHVFSDKKTADKLIADQKDFSVIINGKEYESIATHTFSHSLTSEELLKFQSKFEPEKKKALGELRKEYRNFMKGSNQNKTLSYYAKTNLDEFMAESFTDYKVNPNPKPVSKKVVKILDRLFKKAKIKNGVSAANIPDTEIEKWVTINGVKVPIGGDGKPHKDFDMGKVGERGDDKGGRVGGLVKKATESTDLKSFVKENVSELKEMGIKSMDKANDFFITSKMENMDRKEIRREEAVSIIKGNIKDSIMSGWFRKEDKGFKGKLVEQIMKDKDTANAGLNIMHENYKNTLGSDISFNNFMNKEITLYRGGGLLQEAFTSFSMSKDIAKKFDNGTITEIKIKPKDTLGSYQTTAETEVLIPKQMYNKIKKKDKAKIKNGVSAANIPDTEIEKWVTIGGKKVPIGKDGKIHKDYNQKGLDGGTDIKKGMPSRGTVSKYIEGFKPLFDKEMKSIKSEFKGRTISGRMKTVDSAMGKLEKKGQTDPKDILDIAGMRIESNSIGDVKEDVAKLKDRFKKVLRENNYVDNPKGGYRSHHLIVEKDGRPIEIQVRTKNQTKWGDYSHDTFYKIPSDKVAVFAKNQSTIDKYLGALSNHFFKIDQGRESVLPPCPSVIASIAGCFA